MARLALVRVDEMNTEQRDQYARFPSNLTRALLLVDQRLAGALPALANALRASGLDARVREGIVLRVAALSHSAYERMQHLEQARKAGWSDLEIAAIEAGDPARIPADFVPVMTFTDACIASPVVSDAIFDGVRNSLSARDIATTLLLIGHYMMVARFTGVLEVELDSKPDDWTSEH